MLVWVDLSVCHKFLATQHQRPRRRRGTSGGLVWFWPQKTSFDILSVHNTADGWIENKIFTYFRSKFQLYQMILICDRNDHVHLSSPATFVIWYLHGWQFIFQYSAWYCHCSTLALLVTTYCTMLRIVWSKLSVTTPPMDLWASSLGSSSFTMFKAPSSATLSQTGRGY